MMRVVFVVFLLLVPGVALAQKMGRSDAISASVTDSTRIIDADGDTKIQVEESSDEDIIRADTAGQERVTIDNNVSMSARGGFFTHNATMHASETFTIAATEGTVAAGPLDVQGTVDVQGTLVVV